MTTVAREVLLVRDEHGVFHHAVRLGDEIVPRLMCESTGLSFRPARRIPDEVSEDQLCDMERCWPRRDSDLAPCS